MFNNMYGNEFKMFGSLIKKKKTYNEREIYSKQNNYINRWMIYLKKNNNKLPRDNNPSLFKCMLYEK